MSRGERPRKRCEGCGRPHAGSRPRCKDCLDQGSAADPPPKSWAQYQKWMQRRQIPLPLEES